MVVRHCSLSWDEREISHIWWWWWAQGCSHLLTFAYLPSPFSLWLAHLKQFLLVNLCMIVTASISINRKGWWLDKNIGKCGRWEVWQLKGDAEETTWDLLLCLQCSNLSLLVCIIGSQKEKYKSPSYQIREGDSVNIDVTSPGATLALGMMYFNTGNRYSLFTFLTQR